MFDISCRKRHYLWITLITLTSPNVCVRVEPGLAYTFVVISVFRQEVHVVHVFGYIVDHLLLEQVSDC